MVRLLQILRPGEITALTLRYIDDIHCDSNVSLNLLFIVVDVPHVLNRITVYRETIL